MTWAALAPFIVQHGLEAGIQLFTWYQTSKVVTPEDFDALRAIVNKTKEDYLAESRARLGIQPPEEGG